MKLPTKIRISDFKALTPAEKKVNDIIDYLASKEDIKTVWNPEGLRLSKQEKDRKEVFDVYKGKDGCCENCSDKISKALGGRSCKNKDCQCHTVNKNDCKKCHGTGMYGDGSTNLRNCTFCNTGDENSLHGVNTVQVTSNPMKETMEEDKYSELRKHLYIFDPEEIEFILSKVVPEIRLAITADRKELRDGVNGLFVVYPDGGIHDFGPDEELVSKAQVIALLEEKSNTATRDHIPYKDGMPVKNKSGL